MNKKFTSNPTSETKCLLSRKNLFLICLLFLEACGGGGSSSSQAVSGVLISPRPLAVQKGNSVQFTAADRSGQAIPPSSLTWSVDGTSINGMVNSNGLYSPPSSIPLQNPVTLRATSVADSAKKDAVAFYILTGATLGFSNSNDITGTIAPQGSLPRFHIAVFNQNSYVTWATTNSTNGTGLWYAKLDMNGKFLTPPHNILNDISSFLPMLNPENPVIMFDNKMDSNGDPGVYIAWDDNGNSSNYQIYMVKGPNGKSCPIPCFELFPAPLGQINQVSGIDQISPSISFNPLGKLEVSWSELYSNSSGSGFLIKYKEFNFDGSPALGPFTVVSPAPTVPTKQTVPQVVSDQSGNISVAWLDGNGTPIVNYSRKLSGSAGFSSSKPVSGSYPLMPTDRFSMVLDDTGLPYLVWSNSTPNKTGIFFSKSTDFANFTAPVTLTNTGNTGVSNPTIKIDLLNYLYFSWDDGSSVYFEKSDSSSTSSSPVQSRPGFNPAMEIGMDGRAYLLFSSTGSSNFSTYFMKGE